MNYNRQFLECLESLQNTNDELTLLLAREPGPTARDTRTLIAKLRAEIEEDERNAILNCIFV